MEKGSQETVSTNPQTEEYLLNDEFLISGLKKIVADYESELQMAKTNNLELSAPIMVKVYQKSSKKLLGEAALILGKEIMPCLKAILGDKEIRISTYGDYTFGVDKKTYLKMQNYQTQINELDKLLRKNNEPEPATLIHTPLPTYMEKFCQPKETKPTASIPDNNDDDFTGVFLW